MHYDVVIAGGAAIGSSAAYFLRSHPGFDGTVAVVEPDPSYQYSATALSAASIRHQFSTPENVQMSLFGTRFLRDFSSIMEVDNLRPDPSFVEGGYLFLATAKGATTMRNNQRVQRSLGAHIRLYEPAELETTYPWLQTDDIALGALGERGEGWLDAYAMMQGMRHKAVALGATYVRDKVIGLELQGRKLTQVKLASGQTLDCDAFINAAGTGARQLAQMAGINLPVASKKRSIFYFKTAAHAPDCPMVVDASGAYFRPEGEGFICGIQPPAEDDPECFDFEVQHALFEQTLWPLLAHRVPGFEALRVERSWAGHYDMNMFDQNLILGLHPDVDNLYFANGLSGHGMQQSPAIGRALSELIVDGGFQSLDLSALGWERIIHDQPLIEKGIV